MVTGEMEYYVCSHGGAYLDILAAASAPCVSSLVTLDEGPANRTTSWTRTSGIVSFIGIGRHSEEPHWI